MQMLYCFLQSELWQKGRTIHDTQTQCSSFKGKSLFPMDFPQHDAKTNFFLNIHHSSVGTTSSSTHCQNLTRDLQLMIHSHALYGWMFISGVLSLRPLGPLTNIMYGKILCFSYYLGQGWGICY